MVSDAAKKKKNQKKKLRAKQKKQEIQQQGQQTNDQDFEDEFNAEVASSEPLQLDQDNDSNSITSANVEKDIDVDTNCSAPVSTDNVFEFSTTDNGVAQDIPENTGHVANDINVLDEKVEESAELDQPIEQDLDESVKNEEEHQYNAIEDTKIADESNNEPELFSSHNEENINTKELLSEYNGSETTNSAQPDTPAAAYIVHNVQNLTVQTDHNTDLFGESTEASSFLVDDQQESASSFLVNDQQESPPSSFTEVIDQSTVINATVENSIVDDSSDLFQSNGDDHIDFLSEPHPNTVAESDPPNTSIDISTKQVDHTQDEAEIQESDLFAEQGDDNAEFLSEKSSADTKIENSEMVSQHPGSTETNIDKQLESIQDEKIGIEDNIFFQETGNAINEVTSEKDFFASIAEKPQLEATSIPNVLDLETKSTIDNEDDSMLLSSEEEVDQKVSNQLEQATNNSLQLEEEFQNEEFDNIHSNQDTSFSQSNETVIKNNLFVNENTATEVAEEKFAFLSDDDDLLDDDDSFLDSDDDAVESLEIKEAVNTPVLVPAANRYAPSSVSMASTSQPPSVFASPPQTQQQFTAPQTTVLGSQIVKPTLNFIQPSASSSTVESAFNPSINNNEVRGGQVFNKLESQKHKTDAYDFPLDLVSTLKKPVKAKPIASTIVPGLQTNNFSAKSPVASQIQPVAVPLAREHSSSSPHSVPAINPYAPKPQAPESPANTEVNAGVVPPSSKYAFDSTKKLASTRIASPYAPNTQANITPEAGIGAYGDLPAGMLPPTVKVDRFVPPSGKPLLNPYAPPGNRARGISNASVNSNTGVNLHPIPLVSNTTSVPAGSNNPYAPSISKKLSRQPSLNESKESGKHTRTSSFSNNSIIQQPQVHGHQSHLPSLQQIGINNGPHLGISSPTSMSPAGTQKKTQHARSHSSVYAPPGAGHASRYAPTVHPSYQKQTANSQFPPTSFNAPRASSGSIGNTSTSAGFVHNYQAHAQIKNPENLRARQFPIFHWNGDSKAVLMLPTNSVHQQNVISIIDSKDVDVIPQYFVEFPGPLIKSKTKNKVVQSWVDSTIEQLTGGRENYTSANIALWKILKLKLSEDTFKLSDVASILYDTSDLDAILNSSASLSYGAVGNSKKFNSYKLEANDQIQVLASLQVGNHERALSIAMAHNDYSMAIVIASLMGKEKWSEVVGVYLQTEFNVGTHADFSANLLGVIFQVFVGNSKKLIDGFYKDNVKADWALDNWNVILSAIFANSQDISDLKSASNISPLILDFLVDFGIFLLRNDMTLASHICFVVAGLPFSFNEITPESHVVFESIGAANSYESMLLSELYEYIFTTSESHSNSKITNFDSLVSQKLLHSFVLIEHSHCSLANKYIDAVSSIVKQLPKTSRMITKYSYYIEELKARATNSNGGWLGKPTLSGVWGQLDKSFNKFIGGDDMSQLEKVTSNENKVFESFTPEISRTSSRLELSASLNTPVYHNSRLPASHPPSGVTYGHESSHREGVVSKPTVPNVPAFASRSAVTKHTLSQLRSDPIMSRAGPPSDISTGSSEQLILGASSPHAAQSHSRNRSVEGLLAINSHARVPLSKRPSISSVPGSTVTEQSQPPLNFAARPPIRKTLSSKSHTGLSEKHATTVTLDELYGDSAPITPGSQNVNLVKTPSVRDVSEVKLASVYSESDNTNTPSTDIEGLTKSDFGINKENSGPILISGQLKEKISEDEEENTSKTSNAGVINFKPHENNEFEYMKSNDYDPEAQDNVALDKLSPVVNSPSFSIDENQLLPSKIGESNENTSTVDEELNAMKSDNFGETQQKKEHVEDMSTSQKFTFPPIKAQQIKETPIANDESAIPVLKDSARKESNISPHSMNTVGSNTASPQKKLNPYAPPQSSVKTKSSTRSKYANPYASNPQTPIETSFSQPEITGDVDMFSFNGYKVPDPVVPNEEKNSGHSEEFVNLGLSASPISKPMTPKANLPHLSSNFSQPPNPFAENRDILNNSTRNSSTVRSPYKTHSRSSSQILAEISGLGRASPNPEERMANDPVIRQVRINSVVYTPEPAVSDNVYYDDIVEEDDSDAEEERAEKSRLEQEAKERERKQQEEEEERARQKEAEAKNKEKANTKQGAGWFGWLKNDPNSKKPVKAKLGHKNTFYYDEKLKRWVDKNASEEEKAAMNDSTPPPPPPIIKKKNVTPEVKPRSGSVAGGPTQRTLGMVAPRNPLTGEPLIPETISETPIQASSIPETIEEDLSSVSIAGSSVPSISSPPLSAPTPPLGINLTGKASNDLNDLISLTASRKATPSGTRRGKRSGRGYVNVMDNINA